MTDEPEDEDDWDGDSFLPTYIYDAMKAKKRFDNMGVCFIRLKSVFTEIS